MNPLNIKALLPELRSLVAELSEDLLTRVNANAETNARLRSNFQRIKENGRTGQPYEVWLEDFLDQVAVAWVLGCVFVRFIEDNGLLSEAWIAGEGNRKNLADGNYEIYFRTNPHDTDREFLQYVFRQIGKIPAAAELFDETKTPLWAVGPSGDMARKLLGYFKEIDANQGGLKRRFTTLDRNTQPVAQIYQDLAPQAQFLGDLYQDLSEHARKKYALLQTPEFVAQFLLDRTLTRAIETFGLKNLRLIDPTCGSGHLLLGAFDRLFKEWSKPEYGVSNPVVAAQNALDSLHGVDLNPFAIAITRFRLLVAAIQACGIGHLNQQTFAWKLNLAVGDSLLYGSKPSRDGVRVPIGHQNTLYDPDANLAIEQSADARRILGQGYHVVVGNPPYITPKDKVLNDRYRQLYPDTCHMKYSLGVPFTQRFFELALRKDEPLISENDARSATAGFVGMITANSFMKREFGKKLIESFFPQIDLTHVIDTSGAYIPGHGTPTVILFGRSRKPVEQTVRTAMGIAGEPSTPNDPAQGVVWSSILALIDRPSEQSKYISIADTSRESFAKHPWSIGGGGAAELKEMLDDRAIQLLNAEASSIGITCFTLADEFFFYPKEELSRRGIPENHIRPMVVGDGVRDWAAGAGEWAVFPYDLDFQPDITDSNCATLRLLWPGRTVLSNNKMFGGETKVEAGLQWFEYGRLTYHKLATPLSIVFSNVATHNHFALDRGQRIFECHAPIIKLSANATTAEHLALIGLLNSSTGCFWMKQIFFPKGGDHVGQEGARVRRTQWDERYEFASTGLKSFPLPALRPLILAQLLDRLAKEYGDLLPEAVCGRTVPTAEMLESARKTAMDVRERMIALQEELDWQCYRLYGLTEDAALEMTEEHWKPVNVQPKAMVTSTVETLFEVDSHNSQSTSASADIEPKPRPTFAEVSNIVVDSDVVPNIRLGERAFEIVLARTIKAAGTDTAWFQRHGTTPITDIPSHWPTAYQDVVRRRIERIEADKNIALIERPEYKRRWSSDSWEQMQAHALRGWLLSRLESEPYRRGTQHQPELATTAQMADVAVADTEFMQVAAIYRGRVDFDLAALVMELVRVEAVPLLPVLRYKTTGMRKRSLWERTWQSQREQDIGRDVKIDIPPKFVTADFLSTDFWRLRGAFDVPKERWVSFPYCAPDGDTSLVVGWAGWDHLQRATALVAYYDARKREGWDAKRLIPFLAGLDQLLPWIHQWHPEIDPEYGETAGQSFQHMLEADAHELGLTIEDIRNWVPPEKPKAVRRKKVEA